MSSFTVESARAALAIGPVRFVCNVCGKRHVLGSGAWVSRAADRCLAYRFVNGVWDAYRPHASRLGQVHVALSGACAAAVVTGPPGKDLSSLGRLMSVAYFAAKCGSYRRARAIWNQAALAQHFPGFVDIFPNSCIMSCQVKSYWTLLPPPQEVSRRIADICLGWVCNDAWWDDALSDVYEAGGCSAAVAPFEEARRAAASIAVAAGLRLGVCDHGETLN